MDMRTTVGDFGEFDAAWREGGERLPTLVRVVNGLIGLSRLGEHPVEVDRFAAYLDRPSTTRSSWWASRAAHCSPPGPPTGRSRSTLTARRRCVVATCGSASGGSR